MSDTTYTVNNNPADFGTISLESIQAAVDTIRDVKDQAYAAFIAEQDRLLARMILPPHLISFPAGSPALEWMPRLSYYSLPPSLYTHVKLADDTPLEKAERALRQCRFWVSRYTDDDIDALRALKLRAQERRRWAEVDALRHEIAWAENDRADEMEAHFKARGYLDGEAVEVLFAKIDAALGNP